MTNPVQNAALVFLLQEDNILLAMKKRGFGEGRWNGVGGKVNDGEKNQEAAKRESQEEIGVIPESLHEASILNFHFPDGNKDWKVNVYICTKWKGDPIESEEMKPKWFKTSNIPYEQMWDDDKYWLPEVLKGQYVEADFDFDNNDKVINHQLTTRPATFKI